ncbi:uncharacterized protein LOC129595189 [Paramacrobiotus metropolitanus]|uniref:uncharacterized protein LOC129595189 n=1 Tax=Paramacrobiotus metropolitanus TaxID=2943436 RepID=UPI00244644E0|nr:uncharacterized protein LOC129595189 [Paramacrobiotus metropolitanus]
MITHTAMDWNPFTNASYDYVDVKEEVSVNFSTCDDFLRAVHDFNVSVEMLLAQVDNEDLARDGCNRTLPNMTTITAHPAKYAVIVMYPVSLLLCTMGNILNIIILRRENVVRRGKRWSAEIYLIALAVADMGVLWSQLSLQLSQIDVLANHPKFSTLLNGSIGLSTFLTDTFINSSDWLLIVFSIERLLAIASPLRYGRIVNRQRTIIIVVSVFCLGMSASAFNLYDYYWFYANEDPRCPAWLTVKSPLHEDWNQVQRFFVVAQPLINFLAILVINTIVAMHLLIQRRFRALHVRISSVSDTDAAKEKPLIHMLLVAAVFYVVTQMPAFVWNLWTILINRPFCYDDVAEETRVYFMRFTSIATNVNYSLNFLLYYGVSRAFRRGCREVFCQRRMFGLILDRSGSAWPNRSVKNDAGQQVEKRSLESSSSNKSLLSQRSSI